MTNTKDSTALQEWKWIHKELSDQIDREFTLLGQRMTWLLIGNSFLLSGFILTLGNLDKLGEYLVIGYILLIGIIVIGVTVCIFTIQTMRAALEVVQDRKQSRQICEKCILGFDLYADIKDEILSTKEDNQGLEITVPRNNRTSIIGNLNYKLLPLIVLSFWLVILNLFVYIALPDYLPLLIFKIAIIAISLLLLTLYSLSELKELFQLIKSQKKNR